jgi:hypothetical protein
VTQRSLENVFNEIFAAIDVCLKANIKMPALLLAYSLIDISGWLNSDEKSVKVRFTDWVEKYMLPNSTLRCSSLELYAARCRLLHNYSATSELTSAEVRRIFYAWRPSRVEDSTGLIELNTQMMVRLGKETEQILALQADNILSALQTGTDKILSDIANDPQRAARAYAKAENMMVENQDADIQSLIAAAKMVLAD